MNGRNTNLKFEHHRGRWGRRGVVVAFGNHWGREIIGVVFIGRVAQMRGDESHLLWSENRPPHLRYDAF